MGMVLAVLDNAGEVHDNDNADHYGQCDVDEALIGYERISM